MSETNSTADLDRQLLDGWTRAGMYVAMFGVLLVVLGFATRTTADPVEVQIVGLHNSAAESADDCPSGPDPYWHFVLAPNNNTFRFVSIVLDVSGTTFTYRGSQLIPNGGQADNVFVRVPGGYSLTDLRRSGSFAEVTPGGNVKFVLSHVCPGHSGTTTTMPYTTTTAPHKTTTTMPNGTTTTMPNGTTTTMPNGTTTTVPDKTTTTMPNGTTTTVPDTTTTVPDTTTTTVPDTTTTVPDTTTTVPDSTTTTVPGSTTTTVPGTTTTVPGSTTTTVPGTTTTVPDSTTTTVPDSTTTTVEQRPPATTTTTTTPKSTTTTPKSTTTTPKSTTTTVSKLIVTSGGGGAGRTLVMAGALMILVGVSLVLGSYTRRPNDVVES